MILIDANILLYAYNADAPQHRAAAKWLKALFSSGEIVGLQWISLWAFIRISTNARIWFNPLSTERAFELVNEWLNFPGVVLVQPGPRHLEILRRLVLEYNASGALVSDAALAALAIENGSLLASTDRDFSRFQELRWTNPLSS